MVLLFSMILYDIVRIRFVAVAVGRRVFTAVGGLFSVGRLQLRISFTMGLKLSIDFLFLFWIHKWYSQ